MPIQTGPESHPASLAMGIGSSVVEVASGLEAVPLPPLFAWIGMSYGDLYLINL